MRRAVIRARFDNAIQAFANQLGLRISRVHNDAPVRRQRMIQRAGITLVLDVGANSGQWGQQVRRHGYHGRMISFEPQARAFAELQRNANADSRWECCNFALGNDEGVRTINVAANSVSSSLRPMNRRHEEAAPSSAYIGTESIDVRRLDDVAQTMVQSDDCVLLKIDTQGYELQVLHGGSKTLGRVQVIEVELCLRPLYEGQALFPEVYACLSEHGFTLVGVDEPLYELDSGHLLMFDGIFVRDRQ